MNINNGEQKNKKTTNFIFAMILVLFFVAIFITTIISIFYTLILFAGVIVLLFVIFAILLLKNKYAKKSLIKNIDKLVEIQAIVLNCCEMHTQTNQNTSVVMFKITIKHNQKLYTTTSNYPQKVGEKIKAYINPKTNTNVYLSEQEYICNGGKRGNNVV